MRVINWMTNGYKSISTNHAADKDGNLLCGAKVPTDAAFVSDREEVAPRCQKCRAKLGFRTERFVLGHN